MIRYRQASISFGACDEMTSRHNISQHATSDSAEAQVYDGRRDACVNALI